MTARIRTKRAYRAARVSDGRRILVDRIWPRGMTQDRLRIAEWAKEIAPSDELRRWFGHDPAKWDRFRASYFRELDGMPDEISRILGLLDEGPITLVYGAKNEMHNNAVALAEYLEEKMREQETAAGRSGHPSCFLRPWEAAPQASSGTDAHGRAFGRARHNR
ncbi:DUF488 domain-containing protein [Oricola thermophila]|uniref:DUF488 domain-containing protein n=1 Tax=Oricola thermophila TaxID=2742145 RepID=UPI0031B5F5E3